MPANRQTFANNIAKFVQDEGLDGVDIDWEVSEFVTYCWCGD